MILPDDWKKLQVPLGLVAAAAIGLAALRVFAYAEFARAEDLQQLKQTVETRALQRDEKQYRTRVLELQLKQQFTPKQFTPIDAKLLEQAQADLKEVKDDLKSLQVKK